MEEVLPTPILSFVGYTCDPGNRIALDYVVNEVTKTKVTLTVSTTTDAIFSELYGYLILKYPYLGLVGV